jgi:hypothetical protein
VLSPGQVRREARSGLIDYAAKQGIGRGKAIKASKQLKDFRF